MCETAQMAESLPYLVQVGTLNRALDKIRDAATPDRFTTDYLTGTLGLKGGNARPVIPFLKKTGFLRADGVPTELYKRFRNPTASGAAAAEALRTGYAPLFAMNENAHKLSDADLKGLILQATGLDHDSRVVSAIQGSFKVLKTRATFDAKPSPLVASEPVPDAKPTGEPSEQRQLQKTPPPESADLQFGMNLSYTINLNLPATPDINVFNAIFRSLKENLLKR
jgi:hypothetical protein